MHLICDNGEEFHVCFSVPANTYIDILWSISTLGFTDFRFEVVLNCLEIFRIFPGRQQYWQCELPGGISWWLEIKPTTSPNKTPFFAKHSFLCNLCLQMSPVTSIILLMKCHVIYFLNVWLCESCQLPFCPRPLPTP